MIVDAEYRLLVERVLLYGQTQDFRNGAVRFLVNPKMDIRIDKNFPIVTLKKTLYKKAIAEFWWMISGKEDLNYLHANGVQWWDSWANKKGIVPFSYGHQIRNFNGTTDQIPYIIEQVKSGSRRAHLTLWNPSELHLQTIPMCYTGFDFVRNGDTLETVMNFRSSDVFLGLPMDIIVGALFAKFIAERTGLTATKLRLNLSNAHLYSQHVEAAKEMIRRPAMTPPTIEIEKFSSNVDDYVVKDYKSHPFIKVDLIK